MTAEEIFKKAVDFLKAEYTKITMELAKTVDKEVKAMKKATELEFIKLSPNKDDNLFKYGLALS